MPKYAPPSKWTDQFNTPTVDDLRKLVICDAKKAFDKACSKIESLGDFEVKPIWYGECWFWCVGLIPKDEVDPLAIIIPSPEDIQIATQLTHEFIEQLSTRRLKRFVRDGLELAMPPHDTDWAFWSIPTTKAVEDVMPVLKNKYNYYFKK
ncbi:MAG: hypothetical protein QF444_00385 [Phycisphaerales bacterium]|jgi:hypothetical protein|nr:hypothetical protein [Phycisphaerales bacterium]MDP6692756.1 hypothetical protein [Phycisphaerales bacterium]